MFKTVNREDKDMVKPGDKIEAIVYGAIWRGTVTRVGKSGIIFAQGDEYGIERFFHPEGVKLVNSP